MNSFACSFSVIIATHARPRQLASCMESLTRLQVPAGGFEVIVVDDGSPEPLDEVVNPYRDRLNLILLRQPNGGPGLARNTGAGVARNSSLSRMTIAGRRGTGSWPWPGASSRRPSA